MPAISITALNDPVAIVHIPVNSGSDHTTKLYWTIDRAVEESSEFFNVTSNCIEIAIFASVDLAHHEWSLVNDQDVRISSSWRVFEISSGDDGDAGNYDSPHLRCVSAPLSRAGISILYQSSYYTDFLLVKEEDFERAAGIFTVHGWHIDISSSPPSPRRRSFPPIPDPTSSPRPNSRSPSPRGPEITLISSPLACVGFSRSAEHIINERLRKFVVWPERSLGEWARMKELNKSESEVSEIIQTPQTTEQLQPPLPGRPFVSFTRTEDGVSLTTEVKALKGMFGGKNSNDSLEIHSAGELGYLYDSDEDEDADDVEDGDGVDEGDDDAHHGLESVSDTGLDMSMTFNQGPAISKGSPYPYPYPAVPSPSPYFSQEVDSGEFDFTDAFQHDYADSLRPTLDTDVHPHPQLQLPSLVPLLGNREIKTPEAGNKKRYSAPIPAHPLLSPTPPDIPISWSGRPPAIRSVSQRTVLPGSMPADLTPWLSHRHTSLPPPPTSSLPLGLPKEEGEGKGRKRCLQLDLRGLGDGHSEGSEGAYHLDKSGLLTLFSDLLTSAGIKMLYSSTFHTANILVDATDVARAKKLLSKSRTGEHDHIGVAI